MSIMDISLKLLSSYCVMENDVKHLITFVPIEVIKIIAQHWYLSKVLQSIKLCPELYDVVIFDEEFLEMALSYPYDYQYIKIAIDEKWVNVNYIIFKLRCTYNSKGLINWILRNYKHDINMYLLKEMVLSPVYKRKVLRILNSYICNSCHKKCLYCPCHNVPKMHYHILSNNNIM